jgi:hypothetical protein
MIKNAVVFIIKFHLNYFIYDTYGLYKQHHDHKPTIPRQEKDSTQRTIAPHTGGVVRPQRARSGIKKLFLSSNRSEYQSHYHAFRNQSGRHQVDITIKCFSN